MNCNDYAMRICGHWRAVLLVTISLSLIGAWSSAHAYRFQTGIPGLNMALNTTLRYNLGLRVEPQQSGILRAPGFYESDAKFDQWDIIKNRITIAPELFISYKRKIGVYVSGYAFYDFAYRDSSVPVAPGYPASSYINNEYSDFTKSRYRGLYGELLGGFVFGNFKVGSVPVHFKAGRLTRKWGVGAVLAAQSIAVDQQPTNLRKALAVPGSKISELSFPTAQVDVQFDLTQNLMVAGQYIFEYRHNRFPTGGTYFGGPDYLWQGPDRFFLPAPKSPSGFLLLHNDGLVTPNNRDEPEFGVMAEWKPNWYNGTFGFYYRRFNNKEAWVQVDVPNRQYRAIFPSGTNLFGLSLDRNIGPVAFGLEFSYISNAALAGTPNTDGEGPRGQVLNILTNATWLTSDFPLSDTLSVLGELGYQRLIDAKDRERLFNGGSNCRDRWKGCSTDNSLQMSLLMTPKWIQVFPKWNFTLPITVSYSIYGNGATLAAASVRQGAISYSIGLKGIFRRRYSVALTYSDSYAHYNKNNSGVINYGNGPWFYNDRGRVTLTLETSF